MQTRFVPFLALLVLVGAADCATDRAGTDRTSPVRIAGAIEARLAGPDREARPLAAFYEARAYAPLWIGPASLSARGEALLAALRGAREEGLRPEDYGVAGIEADLARADAVVAEADRAARLADLEIRLSESYLSYGSDLTRGRVDPDRAGSQWRIPRPPADGEGLLRDAAGKEPIATVLQRRLPRLPPYASLRGELGRYRALAKKGWKDLPAGAKLRLRDRGPAVARLRERLAAEGYLPASTAPRADRFDAALDDAVRRYQARNGLDVDGVAGRETIAALNVPAAERVEQISLNMERLRWLPRSVGDDAIFVDVAGFRLLIYEHEQVVFTTPIIVGRRDRPTPIFTATMGHVVFNPYWRVPRSIALKDELPAIRKDPDFFAEHRMEVFRYEKGGGTKEVDPSSVDWSKVSKDNFGYLLRQRPGAGNALGRVKFMFPNPYNVYIHDTPKRQLFLRSERTFSSGCIRVKKPVALGTYLMAGNPGWDRERFVAVIDSGKTRTVRLDRRLPVFVVYLTAWAQDGGPVGFRRDIYGRDAPLARALRGERPSVRKTAAPLPEAGP